MERILRIMLADDDEDDREIFIEVLQELAPQVTVITESDGANLIETLKNPKAVNPDILFLDLNMPRKNGIECLNEIRSDARFKSIPIIIYSTSSNAKLIENTYDKGANLYIQKPQSFRDIKKIIEKVLSLQMEDFFPQPPKSKFVLKADLFGK